MKGRGRDKRGPPDAEDTTASRQNAHGRVALVATGTPADTSHGRAALVATGKGYGRDKRGPPKRGPPARGPPEHGPPARGPPEHGLPRAAGYLV